MKQICELTVTKRKTLLFFVMTSCFFSNHTWGQTSWRAIDSLKKVTATTKNEKQKIQSLSSLADYYVEINVDSGLYYSNLLKDAALEAGDKSAEAYAIADIGFTFMKRGNYAQALVLSFQALNQFYELKDSVNIANTFGGIGHIYRSQNDYKTALYYYNEDYQLAHRIKDFRDECFGAMNLSNLYLQINQPDTALYFGRKSLELIDAKLVDYSRPLLLSFIAAAYEKKQNFELAGNYLRRALDEGVKTQDSHLPDVQLSYAENLFRTSHPDSALYYLYQAKSEMIKNPDQMRWIKAYKLLAKVYEQKKMFDSAYLFQVKATEARDSLFNINQANQVANLTFNEQQRQADLKAANVRYHNRLQLYAVLGVLAVAILSLAFMFTRNKRQKKINSLLQQEKERAENALAQLKSTQSQLVQAEKMASLGELTAGIAHEIQNPLNFINNFSDVNSELIAELKDEVTKGNYGEVELLAKDISENEAKINHHGKRADSIVKSMLQHSRKSSGQKEETDINSLIDEYLRLSYHGLRAKDKSFNATLDTLFDPNVGKIKIVGQDIGRVFLNLFNNAFYAVNEKKKQINGSFEPSIHVATAKVNNGVQITIKDNGTGIPRNALDKIYQPFFTTKPTGEGTGLGLSLSYDIITKGHGGEMKVETKEGEYTLFNIILPTKL